MAVYLVESQIKGGSAQFINERMGQPGNAYGETYEMDQEREAVTYFLECVRNALATMKKLRRRRAFESIAIGLYILEDEQAATPTMTIAGAEVSISGAVGLSGLPEAMDELEKYIRRAAREIDMEVRQEPNDESQARAAERMRKAMHTA